MYICKLESENSATWNPFGPGSKQHLYKNISTKSAPNSHSESVAKVISTDCQLHAHVALGQSILRGRVASSGPSLPHRASSAISYLVFKF